MLIRYSILCALLVYCTGMVLAQTAVAPDSTFRHDPYDLSDVAVVDSTDVYSTKVNHFLKLPNYMWSAMVYPIGAFTIYAEQSRLWVRYFEFFTNASGTFGIFPVAQLGGETGTGGGARMFHANLFGRRKIATAQYVYSGSTGQFGEGLYIDPNFLGQGLVWTLGGGYFKTRNEDASVNGALSDDSRLFELEQVDLETSLEWRLRRGPMAPFVPQFSARGWFGFGRRDLYPILGGLGPLSDPGSSPQARLLKGLGKTYDMYRLGMRVAYDGRDYKTPTRTLSHPINYRFPGRVIRPFREQFYFLRDVAYPERGGLLAVEAEFVTGPDQVKFYRVAAEVARYVTLFWKDRILAVRGRLDKMRQIGNGYIPYTELIRLGSNESMRGYERGHFRGQGGVQFNVEYRYPIWDYWNAFLFWDEGQIFDHFDEVAWGGFHSSWGGGIAFRTEVGLLGKIHVGHSDTKQALFGFSVTQGF